MKWIPQQSPSMQLAWWIARREVAVLQGSTAQEVCDDLLSTDWDKIPGLML